MSDPPSNVSRPWGPWVVGLTAFAGALAWVLPGLGEPGFWSEAELPVLHRTLAALGEPYADLVRSPWLPDTLRTLSYRGLADVDPELALRLPHAVAVAALAAMASGIARSGGSGIATAWLAGVLVLAFPSNAMAARTALGNPVGEATITASILTLVWALSRRGGSTRLVLPLGLAALSLAASIASVGLWLGGALPLFVGAAHRGWAHPRLRPPVIAAAIVVAGIAFMLMLRQEEGYVPILGAAKALDLLEQPHTWRFMAGLQQLGEQTFPWLPLAVFGLLDGRRPWPGQWFVLGLLAFTGWTLIYGDGAVPLSVPVALCCTLAVERLADSRLSTEGRRLALLIVILGMLLLGKDADRLPAGSALPLTDFSADPSVTNRMGLTEHLDRAWQWGLLSVVLAIGITRLPAVRRRTEFALRGAALSVGTAALVQAALGHHVLMPRAAGLLSPASMLERFARWSEAGDLPRKLDVFRVLDPGLEFYGPPPERRRIARSRDELVTRLRRSEATAALIRAADLPYLHHNHRKEGWAFYVLDRSHDRLALVANRLPAGAEDQNLLNAIVVDTPPTLAHETLVRFEDRLELVAWEFEQPVIRGTQGTFTAIFRVLRPLPGGTKLVARLQKGKVSRVNAEPHVLAEGLYPPMYWRAGDFIVHRHTFDVPWLEILPGTHDVIVALKQGKSRDFEITIPAGKHGKHGVRIKNSKRTYAVIGTAEVW